MKSKKFWIIVLVIIFSIFIKTFVRSSDIASLTKNPLISYLNNKYIGQTSSMKSHYKEGTPLPVRKAILLPPIKKIETKGEIKLAVAKLKDVINNRAFVSSAIVFAPGQIKDEKDFSLFDEKGNEILIAVKVLARWREDDSIRSALVQFPFFIEHVYEYATLKWGYRRATEDQPVVEPNWEYPEGIIVLPAQWLCDSGILGEQIPMGKIIEFKAYDEKILKYFDMIKDKGWIGDVVADNYYSTVHTFYQLYIRTGELKYFMAARRELLHYRDSQIIQEGERKGQSTKNGDPRYIYTEALIDDYLLTGDPKSLKIVGYMAEYLKNFLKPEKAFYPKTEKKFYTERQIAFPFLGILNYYELTGDKTYLALADEFMKNLYKTQLQWPSRGGFIHNLYSHDPEEGARPDEYGGSPFMTGFLLEPIIKYHKLTQKNIAADSIFRAVDWLIHEALVANDTSFKYLTADVYKDSGGEPDVNLTIVHGFGYAYRLSGYQNKQYFEIGQKVLNRGVNEAYLGDRKHFNQNYRSSGHYLAYVWEGMERQLATQIRQQSDKQQPDNANQDYLVYENFDHSLGKFKSLGDSELKIDEQNVYLNGHTLNVHSKFASSNLSAGLETENWNLDFYPKLHFAYQIPLGTPVGLRAKTRFGDWICLGGTKTARCADTAVKAPIRLLDDGTWHEVDIDIKATVQSLLIQLNELSALQFFTNSNATREHQFWIDEFKIVK